MKASALRAAVVAAATIAFLVLGAGPALAGSVSIDNGTLTFVGGTYDDDMNPLTPEVDEQNIVTVDHQTLFHRFVITDADPDAAAPAIDATDPCTRNSSSEVTCPDDTVLAMSLDGQGGNDTLTVDADPLAIPATLLGGSGNDTLNGGSGNDMLNGGSGSTDVLNGNAGDDTFNEATDTVTMNGGAGSDKFVAAPDSPQLGTDTFNGGTGTDTADYGARSLDLTITADGAAGDGRATEMDNIGSDVENIIGGSGNDSITGNANDNGIDGEAGADTLMGGDGNDVLIGGTGNDALLDGGNNDDIVIGGAGDDTEHGGAGNDVFEEDGAPNGSDTISGGTGNGDTVDYSQRSSEVDVDLANGTSDGDPGVVPSGEGDDVENDVENAIGGSGDDILTGVSSAGGATTGANTLVGGPGNDTLGGQGGGDALEGDAGDDDLKGGPTGSTGDTLDGGSGTDAADYSGRTSTHPVTLTIGGGAVSGESGENDTIFSSVENLIGGADNDTLNGDAGDNDLRGGPGHDTYSGGAGSDTADYSDKSSAVVATLDGAANDGATGDANENIPADVENITGGTANDTLTGDGQDNVLNGGPGNDDLRGNAGDDTLIGGPEPDPQTVGPLPSDADVMSGGAGNDTADYSARSVGVIVTLDNQAGDGSPAGAVRPDASAEGDNVKDDVENVTGGAGGDTLTGSAAANVLTGGAGDDTLTGLAGDDTFNEGSAANGGDKLAGGDGHDTADYSRRSAAVKVTINGQADDGASGEGDNVGTDVEEVDGGSAGDDLTASAAGGDTLKGNAGDDKINSRQDPAKADTVNCGPGNDTAIADSLDTLAECDINGDADNDGVPDSSDNCPGVSNPTQADQDKDGKGDACDDDIDGDGVANASDNCATVPNANQSDIDKDGKGDACDDDIDGDGVPNATDKCPTMAAATANGCPAGADTTRPVVTLTVASRATKFKTMLRRGLHATLGCNEPCAATGRLQVSRIAARRLRVGSRTIGSGTVVLRTGGKRTLVIRLTSAAKRALKNTKLRKVGATLSVRAVDAAGNLTTKTKSLTLKR